MSAHVAVSACLDCPEPVAPGRKRCPTCLEVHRVRARTYYTPKNLRGCTSCGQRGHYAKTCRQEIAHV